MEQLSNPFSVLALQDGTEDPIHSSPNAGESTKNGKSSRDKLVPETGNKKDETPTASISEYKFPLVWIDLEMTGLNVDVDRILEIACIITDGNLSKSVEGPELVIHQSQECLDDMGDWCQHQHRVSGLTDKVLQSKITEREAEQQVIEFVKQHVGPIDKHSPHLAGNSVYMDYIFLKKYMPELASMFSHVLVDVSSVKSLCFCWYPRASQKAPRKKSSHRAMDDIRESIMELKYYKENIFKAKK